MKINEMVIEYKCDKCGSGYDIGYAIESNVRDGRAIHCCHPGFIRTPKLIYCLKCKGCGKSVSLDHFERE